MSRDTITCPRCSSKLIVKNGGIHNGKQNFKCRSCTRQFVQDPQQNVISQPTKDLIDKRLLEKLPLAGIAGVVDVSEQWLQSYVNAKYESTPKQAQVKAQKRGA